MFFISFFRTIKYAFQDFFRNFWLSFVTLTVLILTLLSINLLVTFHYLAETSIALIEERLDISVYFKPEVSDGEAAKAQDDFLALPQVAEVRFVSREERLQEFEKTYEEDELISSSLDELTENPFGPALIIKAKEPGDYEGIVAVLNQEQYQNMVEAESDDYQEHQQAITKIAGITGKARRVGEGIALVFSLIAVLIVFNTIRVAIYTHRDEIRIMKTVGAENWFVRFPYLFQGVFFSVFAMGFTALVWYPFMEFADPYVLSFFGEGVSVISYFEKHFWPIAGYEFLGVLVLCVVSSVLAMQRYLKAR